LEIFVSSKTFPLMETVDHSHFKVLRNKLKWGWLNFKESV